MNRANIRTQELLQRLPKWSGTMDPYVQVDRPALVSSAIEFLELWPDIHDHYQFTDQSLGRVLSDGVPKDVVEKLKRGATAQSYDRGGLSELLSATLGEEVRQRNEEKIRHNTEIWDTQLATYHDQYCFPRLHEERASAIYLFFRIIFDLPSHYAVKETKVFGGWLHPSINADGATFDLSWPVEISQNPPAVEIQSYLGYFGKGYDCRGEFAFFAAHFPLRSASALKAILQDLH